MALIYETVPEIQEFRKADWISSCGLILTKERRACYVELMHPKYGVCRGEADDSDYETAAEECLRAARQAKRGES